MYRWPVLGQREADPFADSLSSLLFYAWSHGRNFHRREISGWLEEAGFEEIEIHRNERSPWRIVVIGRAQG